jgi:hypothetical protein
VQIYVALIDEGVPVWRPASAEHVAGDVYRLSEAVVPSDERWEFQPGDLVRCHERRLNGDPILVATTRVEFT